MATTLTNSPADEDNGQGQPNTAASGPITSAPTATATGQGGTTGGTGNVAPGANNETAEEVPGKRLNNPLGNFSSYTYQLSLYMITPDAYDAFISSGRRRINVFSEATAGQESSGGAFLIAQSGGVNNKTSKRAPGFDFDYGIDNLSFRSIISGESETTTIEFKFNITEPYGFSFFTKLRNAAEAINGYAEQLGRPMPPNVAKQNYILGIRFFGYDESGNIMTGTENYDGDTLDPNSTGNGLFETFYDIAITGIKFKLDGKATIYNVSAESSAALAALSIKRGLVPSPGQLEAATVGEAIDLLLERMNKYELEVQQKNGNMYPNTYSVVYLRDAEVIRAATMVSPEDLDKIKFPSSGVKNTGLSTDAAGFATKPNVTKKTVAYNINEPIVNVFNNIITQSSFLRDALLVVYTTATEPAKTGGFEENKPNTKQKIQWYHCSVEISNARWDEVLGDWAYDIKYIIQTYQTPAIDSVYSNAGQTYYGPHKRYEYWFGKKNSEVLGYYQDLDNTYFNVVLAPTGTTTSPPVPIRPGQRTNRPRLGKLGNAMEAQNNYLTSLINPGSYVTSQIQILGDPDFLMQPQSSSLNDIYNRFYGPGGLTINPNGGQVFVEIDFQEAIDYESGPGVLKLNDKILFWDMYPENLSKIPKGVSYKVREVLNTFINGTFKQTLLCNLNQFTDVAEADSSTGPAPGNQSATTNSTGLGILKKENLPANSQPTGQGFSLDSLVPSYIPQPVTNPTTPVIGPVADDDGNG